MVVGGADTGAADTPCEAVVGTEVEDATGTMLGELALGEVAVAWGALTVAEPPLVLVAASVVTLPVIALPVKGGEFSKLDEGDGVSSGVEVGF